MAKNTEITGFETFDRIDNVRKELDAKIDQKVSDLDNNKIADKVSSQVFWGMVTVLVTIFLAAIGGLAWIAYAQNSEINGMHSQIAVIESRLGPVEKRVGISR